MAGVGGRFIGGESSADRVSGCLPPRGPDAGILSVALLGLLA